MSHTYVRFDLFICVIWPSYMWYDSFTHVTWLIHTFDLTCSYVWHDLHICDMTPVHMWHDSYIRSIWLVHMGDMTQSYINHNTTHWQLLDVCDMTHSCMWHDSCMRATWLVHMCDVTQSFINHQATHRQEQHDSSFISVTRLLYICDMTHIYVRRDMLISMTWLNRTSAIKQHIDKSFPPHAGGINDGKWWRGGKGELRKVGWAVGNRMGCTGPFL